MSELQDVQDAFIAQWGLLGSRWGVSKTMAQIQALLMVSSQALTTDDIMERLEISRGNAHGGLKDLQSWGLAHKVHKKGQRKEYYQTEKDPWKIFFIVARERRRREIQPVLEVLRQCEEESRDKTEADFAAFHGQMKRLADFVSLADSALGHVSSSEKSRISSWLLRLVKGSK